MSEGGCFCGAVRIKSTGDVQVKALCHCADCKKITGSTYSTNIVVPGEGFSITQGTPKTYAKKADSGSEITSYFCGDCGTTLFRSTPSFGDAKIIKVGVMDNAEKAFADAKPAVELFAKDRVSWVGATEGAEQKQAMS